MQRMTTALAVLIASASAVLVAQRFDNVVRADFFAGFRGDEARLTRAMATCERALADDPGNAAAMVWHGAGLFYRSGGQFQAGNWKDGMATQERGLKEMDAAVALQPDDLQTLIPRGAVLLAGAPHLPDLTVARPLLEKAVGDYEKVSALQVANGPMAAHSRGELLGGLAVGYRLLGDNEKSMTYLQRIVKELPNTEYAARASAWIANPATVKPTDRFCIGCHE